MKRSESNLTGTLEKLLSQIKLLNTASINLEKFSLLRLKIRDLFTLTQTNSKFVTVSPTIKSQLQRLEMHQPLKIFVNKLRERYVETCIKFQRPDRTIRLTESTPLYHLRVKRFELSSLNPVYLLSEYRFEFEHLEESSQVFQMPGVIEFKRNESTTSPAIIIGDTVYSSAYPGLPLKVVATEEDRLIVVKVAEPLLQPFEESFSVNMLSISRVENQHPKPQRFRLPTHLIGSDLINGTEV